ncbi:hypothetical protein E0M25_08955 [Bacillus mycoides]|uniref:hypothetical protein n=1 Tax=Bacillus mycoides TaxID=1405 RepID=UPI00103F6412|nr:hypothetical protein [Bacillus mycoides]TBX79341.1 hypothetical protein E0M25_08955 [Bacillus mycoides]
MNAKQLIQLCDRTYNKFHDKPKKLVPYLKGNWGPLLEENMKRYIPSIYVSFYTAAPELIPLANERYLEMQKDIRHRIEEYLENEIESLITPETVTYIQEVIIPHYQGKFTRDRSREISFLPLSLRLYIYWNMLMENRRAGTISTEWNIQDRLIVTASKLGLQELAQLISIQNFIHSLTDESKEAQSEQQFLVNWNFTLTGKDIRITELHKRGYAAGRSLQEINYSLTSFLQLDNIHDIAMAKKVFHLLTLFYPFLQEEKLVKLIPLYLETGDESYVSKFIQHVRKVPISFHHTYVNKKNEVVALNEEDAKLYNAHWEAQLKACHQKHSYTTSEVTASTGNHLPKDAESQYLQPFLDKYGHLTYFYGKIVQGFINPNEQVFYCIYFNGKHMNGTRYKKEYFDSHILPQLPRVNVYGDPLKLSNGKKNITSSNRKVCLQAIHEIEKIYQYIS